MDDQLRDQEVIIMNPTDPARDNEIVSSRRIAAPRGRVFAAFADPDQLTRWFGPNGFTSTFETFDFRVGGDWTFVFHGPNGTGYPNQTVFVEIVENERIVYDHISAPQFRMTMTLTDEDHDTRLTWRMTFADAKLCDTLKPVCVPANEQNFNRIEKHLASR